MPASEGIKMRHLKILIVMAVVGVHTSALADSQTKTDVNDVVSKALNAYGPVSVTETTYETVSQLVCSRSDDGKRDCQVIPTNVPKQTTSQKVLTASNIRVVSNTPVVFAATQYTSFPTDIKASFTHYFNCVAPGAGVTPDTKMATLTVTYSRTTSSTITKGITHTVTDTVGFNWSNKASETPGATGASGTWGITGSIAIADQGTTSDAETSSSSTQITRTDSNIYGIPPLTLGFLEYYVSKIGITIPFSTEVTVDANLSTNDKGYTLLSQVMPDPATRTFMITGTITSEDGSDGDWLHASVTYNSVADCLAAFAQGASAVDVSKLTFEPYLPH
jgi:hypothetical protein